jgi:hypothetical protein
MAAKQSMEAILRAIREAYELDGRVYVHARTTGSSRHETPARVHQPSRHQPSRQIDPSRQ